MDNQLENKCGETIRGIEREGAEELARFLEDEGFFVAPASTKYHLSVPGGLLLHSFNVFHLLQRKVDLFDLHVPDTTVVVCGLLHDVGKLGMYALKEDGTYQVRDALPMDHAEKSVIFLQRFLNLSNEEILAIRYHHLGFEVGLVGYSVPRAFAFKAALEKFPLIPLVHAADLEATFVLEMRKNFS